MMRDGVGLPNLMIDFHPHFVPFCDYFVFCTIERFTLRATSLSAKARRVTTFTSLKRARWCSLRRARAKWGRQPWAAFSGNLLSSRRTLGTLSVDARRENSPCKRRKRATDAWTFVFAPHPYRNNLATLGVLSFNTRAATVTAKTDTIMLSMDRKHFVDLLGDLEVLVSKGGDEGKSGTSSGLMSTNSKLMETLGLTGEGLPPPIKKGMGKILGRGAFGAVRIIYNIKGPDGKQWNFALKKLCKRSIKDNNLQEHVFQERDVMLALDHPFILKLYNTYQDTKHLYFLVELCIGGEMFTYLRKAGRFVEKCSKFYAGSVLLAFEQMHKDHIVYRDLKPENLILDQSGYLKVVDFGLAKVVTDRTWTLCGTPDYLAPEIILSKGHNKAVDYWALGVLIYEMSAGFVPFYSDDAMEVYQLILSHDLKFPSHFSRSCVDLCQKLMHSNPTKRIGTTKGGVQSIIKHKWFSGFDWEGLLKRDIDAPIKPRLSGAGDTSNFDEYEDEEEDCPDDPWDPPFAMARMQ